MEKAINLREAEKAVTFVTVLKSALRHRHKLIRIADNSEAGLATILEYENLEVADDSDDDKRIRRAEERAKKKAELKKASYSYTPSGYFRAAGSQFRSGQAPMDRRFAASRQFERDAICFRCVKAGHFANGCALLSAGAGSMATATVNS
jgi:thioesterase domain-containing protein